MALYNEERPATFSQVKGQDKVVKILSHDLKKGIVHNAYLFCGTRGTGKTTIARILAQAVNCSHLQDDGSPCGACESCQDIRSGTSVDVFELDAASNNGVDDIRAILENVQYKPIRKKKVFILDEVHMLSTAASNALLKVLEEPPEDVVFVLCTTERQKILPTIISRCAVYEFEKISVETISAHLAEVCERHGVSYEKKALDVIAKAADGAMRDALSILDKFFSSGEIRLDEVGETLGMPSSEIVFGILSSITEKNPSGAVDMLKKHTAKGGSLSCLIEEIFLVLLDVVEFQKTGDRESVIGSTEYVDGIVDTAYRISTEKAFQLMDELRRVYQQKNGDVTFSLMAAFIAAIYEDSSAETLREDVSLLKKQVSKLQAELETLKKNCVSVPPTKTVCVSSSQGADAVVDAETGTETDTTDSESDCSYDEEFLYDSCMREFDSLPESPSNMGNETEPVTAETPATESVSLTEQTNVASGTSSSLEDMQRVPDGLSFDELAKMASAGVFDDCDHVADREEETASSTEPEEVYPDSVGDAFARLFPGMGDFS